jgi:hypothetical protein
VKSKWMICLFVVGVPDVGDYRPAGWSFVGLIGVITVPGGSPNGVDFCSSIRTGENFMSQTEPTTPSTSLMLSMTCGWTGCRGLLD